VDPVHRVVSGFLRERQLRRESPLLIAVSGGADSIALSHVLAALGQRVGIAHVHHGLRGLEAEQDLEFVRTLATELGVPFWARRVDARRRDGRSPEARARDLRYAALEHVRAANGYAAILTAHTLDDQAETVLLRAARGASPAGLAGIGPSDPEGRVLRPLLRVRRADVRRYLRERGLAWREDSTNEDRRVPRNRIRHQVLDALEAAQPGAVPALARLADASRELSSWLRQEASRAPGEDARATRGIDRSRLLELPPPIRTQALVELLGLAGLRERVTRDQLERLVRLLLSDSPRGRVSLPGGWGMVREGERLWLHDPADAEEGRGVRTQPLVPPLPIEIPERDVRFEWRSAREDAIPPRGVDALLLPEGFAEELRVRSVAPRDRMVLAGESRSRAVRELFRVARWSSRARREALVVTWREEIVWVVGLAGADFPGSPGGAWELRAVRLSASGAAC
jgi:tRNA(Ile)-lysidine synthase